MRTVRVTGHGSAEVVPDAAVVRLSVVHQATALTEALEGAESARESLVAALRETPTTVPATVGSGGLSVWPSTDQEGRATGFTAEHPLTVACGSLGDAGHLVEAAAQAAGDRLRIEGVSLVVSDPAAAQDRAREAAWVDARRRADRLARLADLTLGAVDSVVEGGGIPTGARGFAYSPVSSKAAVSFEPGQTTVESSVTVTFSVEPSQAR